MFIVNHVNEDSVGVAQALTPEHRESQLRQIYSLYRSIMGYTDNWKGHPTFKLWYPFPHELCLRGESTARVSHNRKLTNYFLAEKIKYHAHKITWTANTRRRKPVFAYSSLYLHLSRGYVSKDSFYKTFPWGNLYPVEDADGWKTAYRDLIRDLSSSRTHWV